MSYARELADPWGLLLAASATGVAWAIHLPVAATLGVGVVVLAARAAVAGWSSRVEEVPEPRVIEIEADTPEAQWLLRAAGAQEDFASIAGSLAAGPLADQVNGMAGGIDDTVRGLNRLASRAVTTGRAIARLDPAALAADERRLLKARKQAGSGVRAELDRSLESVRSQLAVHERLTAAYERLMAQLESGTIGLEGLVVRVVELSATTADYPAVDGNLITDLTDQLEGIRAGVAETEETVRRTVG
ncbi:hypothetical protein V5P93_000103 [Actinokineospora auranticolor]|uniref:Uncharacterized protein n=1 Tax=Actinokineospora auranticolor TaxID=155976 RepID=A0A2S6GBT4_9PSEU|nr:hypothetical protein [Actinokineospora auranticolor]PPK61735.1 hypothetical protein CLV40_13932 [Actinokineospora auranticolor]